MDERGDVPDDPAMQKTVCVVGAGAAGIASVKACVQDGHRVTCYEQHDVLGGYWRYTEKKLDLHHEASCHFTHLASHNKESECFSDYSFPESSAAYVSHQRIHDYLTEYAETFDILKYIHCNTRVVEVKKADDYEVTGRWKVSVKAKGGAIMERVFDAVIVASGFYRRTHVSEHPGREKFRGKLMTMSEFRRGKVFHGESVLVIGNGVTAADIATEAAQEAKKVYLSVGDGALVYPRYTEKDEPSDFLFTRYFFNWISWNRQNQILEETCAKNLDQPGSKHGTHLDRCPLMLSDFIPKYINNQQLVVKGHVDRFEDRHHVKFKDGTTVGPIDHVVMACGYHHEFNFLEKELVPANLKEWRLYKQVWPVALPHATLALVGCLDVKGPIFPVYELQARWVSRVIRGQCLLPPVSEMVEDIQRYHRTYGTTYWEMYKLFIPSLTYCDEIADLIGCKPSLWRHLVTDPAVGWALLNQPLFPAQYRLVGPGALEQARDTFLGARDRVVVAAKRRQRSISMAVARHPSRYSGPVVLALALLLLSSFITLYLSFF